MQFFLGAASLVLNVVGYVPYIRDILRGIVKPQRITWGIWTILVSVTAANQVLNNGGWSSLFVASTAVLVATTFILSFRFGMGGSSRVDRWCLVLAGVLIVYWLATQDTRFSTLIAVCIDAIGAVPTLIKTYHHPETEAYTQWVMSAIAGVCSIAAVSRWDWVLFIYPAYVAVMNGAIVATKYCRELPGKRALRK